MDEYKTILLNMLIMYIETTYVMFIAKYAYTHIYIYIYIYSDLQKYWNSEANSFIFAVDWKHLGLTSKDEYEMRDQHFSFYFHTAKSPVLN